MKIGARDRRGTARRNHRFVARMLFNGRWALAGRVQVCRPPNRAVRSDVPSRLSATNDHSGRSREIRRLYRLLRPFRHGRIQIAGNADRPDPAWRGGYQSDRLSPIGEFPMYSDIRTARRSGTRFRSSPRGDIPRYVRHFPRLRSSHMAITMRLSWLISTPR